MPQVESISLALYWCTALKENSPLRPHISLAKIVVNKYVKFSKLKLRTKIGLPSKKNNKKLRTKCKPKDETFIINCCFILH